MTTCLLVNHITQPYILQACYLYKDILTGMTKERLQSADGFQARLFYPFKRLGLDLVPRCGAEMVDPATMSCVQLYQVHLQSSEKTQDISARGTMRKKEPQGKFLTHHLYLCMRDFGHHIGEDTEIYFSLYDGKKSKFLRNDLYLILERGEFEKGGKSTGKNIEVTVQVLDSDGTVLQGSLVACLIGLLQLLDESHYKKLWEELGDKKPLKDFLLRAFLVLRDLVKQDVFPPDWLVMRMVTNQVILTALGHLAPPLIYWFLDSRGAFAHQNKVFVYRGLAYERMEAFTQRLQTEFPSANILSKNSPPSHTIQQSDVQYIQICNVKPLPERGPPCINPPLAPVPDKIAQYYQVNDVRTFQLDRPMHKGPIDKDNEFKSLWLERTIMTISSPLPGILRWFEVVESNVEEVAPIQFACETIDNVNKDVKALISQYVSDPKRNINPLSMRLQGTIDANVMGGIAKYQQAFFTAEFARGYPQYIPYINRLHILILEQVDVLENGLVVHGQLAPPGVQPLHKRLQERFAGLRQSIRKPPTESIIHSPLPPVPDQYINAGYHPVEEGEDIYSRPGDLDLGEGDGEAPCLPQRPRSAGYGTLPPADKPKPAHQRLPSKSSVHKRQSSDSGFSSCTAHMRNSWSETYEEAPPLPPRGFTPDKRSSGEPPSLHRRQDSISQRDSSYSDNISVYEDCVVPNTSFLFSTGSTSPSSPCPPPLPPKVINSVVTSEETSHREVVTENYSVPKLQAGEETNQEEDSNVVEENNQTCDEN
ncbi:hypothetical protein M8J76_009858 [Diaphorina citri]|nr:hypothetical protein M8J76_009858 [Diaphorina citri]